MRAHPTWQRPLRCHSPLFFPFFSLVDPGTSLVTCSYLAFTSARLPLTSLRSNNYRNFHPIIINTRESSREAGADGDPANRTATLLSSPLLRLDQARNFQDPPQDSISVSYLRLQPRRSAATVHGYRRTNLASKPHTPIRSIRSEPAHQKTIACFT